MSEQRNPADKTGWVGQLWDAIRGVRDDVRDLQQAQGTYLQEATVQSFAGGDYATVQFAGGEQVLARKFVGYTPANPHVVLVGVSEGAYYIVGHLS